MKKTCLSLCLLISILLMCSCNQEVPPPTESSAHTESQKPSSDPISTPHMEMSIEYFTFEECLDQSTHIVSATYTGRSIARGDYQDLIFQTVSQIKGTALPSEIHLRVQDASVSVLNADLYYSVSASDYEVGKTYLLVLDILTIGYPYLGYDIFSPYADIRIVEDTGKATMYGSSSPKAHSTNQDALEQAESITAYIREYLGDKAVVGGEDDRMHTLSEDINDIVPASAVIFKVTPVTLHEELKGINTGHYTCTLEQVFKGDVTAETVEVRFEIGTVQLGTSYIVMANPFGEMYLLSSRNSVHPTDDAALVQEIEALLAAE